MITLNTNVFVRVKKKVLYDVMLYNVDLDKGVYSA